jgi:hypothetical protein
MTRDLASLTRRGREVRLDYGVRFPAAPSASEIFRASRANAATCDGSNEISVAGILEPHLKFDEVTGR